MAVLTVESAEEAGLLQVTTAAPSLVLPKADGHCDADRLSLTITRGNADQDWVPFLSSLHLTPKPAQKHGYWLQVDRTHIALQVPCFSVHVTCEGVTEKLWFHANFLTSYNDLIINGSTFLLNQICHVYILNNLWSAVYRTIRKKASKLGTYYWDMT